MGWWWRDILKKAHLLLSQVEAKKKLAEKVTNNDDKWWLNHTEESNDSHNEDDYFSEGYYLRGSSGFGYKSGSEASSSSTSTTTPYVSTYKGYSWTSAGGVVLLGLGLKELDYVFIVKPSGNYGPFSFPKGRVDDKSDENDTDVLRATAIREVKEEAGIDAKFLPDGYIGSGKGLSSLTHYWMMVRVGGNTSDHDWESEYVKIVTLQEAKQLFGDRNKRDVEIAEKAEAYIKKLKERMYPDQCASKAS